MFGRDDEAEDVPAFAVIAWVLLLIVALTVSCEPGGALAQTPRDKIKTQIQRIETVTLAQLLAEKANAEAAIARFRERIAEQEARLARLNAEIATLNAKLPSPTPTPVPTVTPTPKGGR